jgi:hypothetical protein
MTFVCPNCSASTGEYDPTCRACGAELSGVSLNVSKNDKVDDRGPAGSTFLSTASRFWLKLAHVSEIISYGAGGLLALLLTYHLFSQAFSLDAWELIVASLAVVVVLLSIYINAGLRTLLNYGIYLSIYFAFGIFALAIASVSFPSGYAWPSWQIWVVYTGVYSLLFIGVMQLVGRMARPARDQARLRAIADEATEAHMRREAALTQLPSHSWYLLACWVTGVAMFGSFATTAIGFYQEIVDPYAPWLIRFSVPIGLSAMAAFIIWSGWNFVFLRMRVALHVWERLLAFVVGFAILVPLTLAIHTIFGIIGVGGTEGLRAHYMWYADVLSGYQKRAEDLRQIEVSFLPTLGLMGDRFKKLAADEINPSVKASCGAGQGDLWKYYTDRSAQVDSIIKQIAARRDSNGDLPKSIEALRRQIRDPGKDFRSAQENLEEQFNKLRSDTVALEGRSVMNSIQFFISQLASVVEQETFFNTWSSCQARSKDTIKEEISRFLVQIKKDFGDAERRGTSIKQDAARQIPRERRIESFSVIDRLMMATVALPAAEAKPTDANRGENDTIPIFVPLRPFWAVVSYAGQLPGYVALQLALDLSPAILGLLFAVMAPVPVGASVVTADVRPTPTAYRSEKAAVASASSHENVRTPPELIVSHVANGATKEGNREINPSREERSSIRPVVVVGSSDAQDEKIKSVYLRISGQRDKLFDDLGRCEALLNDTLLSRAEVQAMMAVARAEIPQRLVGRPDGTVDLDAVIDAASRSSRETALDPAAARQAVDMWIHAFGLRIADGESPAVTLMPNLDDRTP